MNLTREACLMHIIQLSGVKLSSNRDTILTDMDDILQIEKEV